MPRPKKGKKGKWVFVEENLTPEEERQRREDRVFSMLTTFSNRNFHERCKAVEQMQDYLPSDNDILSDVGDWILIKSPPESTEYTVEFLSVWFAEPWPMEGDLAPYRVKVLTPHGELGLFPREYSKIGDVSMYMEFVGQGMNVNFFGGGSITNNAVQDKLFYIRSRGISKQDAFVMLLGEIKQHGVLWLSADKEVQQVFSRSA